VVWFPGALRLSDRPEAEQALKQLDWEQLASDGLYGALTPLSLSQALGRSPSVTKSCDALMTAALEAGASDNVTAIVFEQIGS